jgi:hypothetical protein
MTMQSEFLSSTGLLPGDSLRIAVDAGTMLLVERGSVSIAAPPSWLAENMFSTASTLREGQAHVVASSGWIEIRALSAARVRGVPRAVPVRRLASPIRRLAQLLTG